MAHETSVAAALVTLNYAFPAFTSSNNSCFASSCGSMVPTCLLLPPPPVATVRIFPATQYVPLWVLPSLSQVIGWRGGGVSFMAKLWSSIRQETELVPTVATEEYRIARTQYDLAHRRVDLGIEKSSVGRSEVAQNRFVVDDADPSVVG